MAKFLSKHTEVKNVFYPGLKTHPQYELAKTQMKGFGGMLSFELADGLDAMQFQKELKLIKSSMSLAGIESTVLSPHKTSHVLLTQQERDAIGVSDNLIRFSVGIESKKDLIDDIEQAIKKVASSKFQVQN
jgi:cystathionine beta-lyase